MGQRVAQMSTRQAAAAAVEAVRGFIADLGLPTRLRDVGASKDDFREFAQVTVKRYSHHLANNPRLITEDDIVNIYQAAW
jgi:alcohol dehydrogenase class IV